jgi:conjugative transfer signal peptidase TraF
MKTLKIILVLLLILVSISVGLYLFSPLRLNWYTASLPKGIYLKTAYNVIERGDFAATCLNQEQITFGKEREYLPPFSSDDCDHGLYAVGKQVYGIPGDVVTLTESGEVVINGKALGLSRLSHDSKGRDMPALLQSHYALKDEEYWLMSAYTPNSWDSRYWGPVSIAYQLEPIWIW